MAKWRKLGRLFEAPAVHPELISHAANPLAVPLGGDLFRVFYSGRDAHNRSAVGAVDIDLAAQRVVSVCKRPLFSAGPPGSFYRDGVSIGTVYDFRGECAILFMGWQNEPGQHWRGDVGRLRLCDDLTLQLDSPEPLMGVDREDPISLSYPWVIAEASGLRMWYGSTVAWDAGNGEMLHVIKYATSCDGRDWQRHGQAVPHILGVAQAFSRPAVYRDASGFHMWFSFRGGRGSLYRIGYAFSNDGLTWENRLDQSGIDVGAEDWDSEMIEYPFVFSHEGHVYMLYNGNGFGRSGVGLAVLEHL